MSDQVSTLPKADQMQSVPVPAMAGENFVFVESTAKNPARFPHLNELFSWQGRYARDRFWGVYLAAVALSAVGSPMLASVPLMLSLFWFVLTWVMCCCVIKRFHDRRKTGWWLLVGLVPFLGTLWIIVDCGLLEGDAGVNACGQRGLRLSDYYESH